MNRFQRILVPLDGSLRAERALPLAARIARASGGSLILLRVIEAMPEQETTVTSASALEKKRVSAQLADAQQYLTALTHAREIADIPLTVVVQAGSVIPTIMAQAQSAQADLLVLCGLQGSWEPVPFLDSMAEQCLEQTTIPLLLVPTHGAVLRRQRLPFTLLLSFDQEQPERSLLESVITLLTTLAVREHDQPEGRFACMLRAFPASFNVPRQPVPFPPRAEKRCEGVLEASEGRYAGDLLALGMPPQPERAQWMDEHRKDTVFSAGSLPLLVVPLPAQSQVGAKR